MRRALSARTDLPVTRRELWQAVQKPTLLHEFFERAAARHPDRVAIDTPPGTNRAERRTITYRDLDRKSNALAHFLADLVAEECVVAIVLPRDSEHLYMAQLAVLKAGAAYTCIPPGFPDDQWQEILGDSRAVAVLGDGTGVERARRLNPELECTLDVVEWIESRSGEDKPPEPAPWLSPHSLAYVIYTSGTTGRPKGVMIEHGSIANLVQGDLETLGITPFDRCGQSASSAYDSSVEETWFALASGATLVVMDDEATRLGPDLIAWLRRERVTLFAPSPTLLRATGCENPEKELPDLAVVHVGGEALPADVAERWSKGRRLINDYGPTETTVTAMRGLILDGASITIGRPVPGVHAWVLDENLEEVAPGERGELCVGGIVLARGYMNDPELTARKFPNHPRLGRIYRTGDLVHRGDDGRFFCHGRIDSQVKIRGYRIELEAIESRLADCTGVREAACRVQGEASHAKLIAFVVPQDRTNPPVVDDLKQALQKVLPDYMVPSFFGFLDGLPTNVSGKLNRKALPTLNFCVDESQGEFASPRNPLELKVAAAFQSVLKLGRPVSINDDFFNVLGGDSLVAAQLISTLRDDPTMTRVTVRDLYECRTVAQLAGRIGESAKGTSAGLRNMEHRVGSPAVATFVQVAWIMILLLIAAPIIYGLIFWGIPIGSQTIGLIPLMLCLPAIAVIGTAVYTLMTISFAVAVKKIVIGDYQPTRAPIWGEFYVRNWMVVRSVRLIPWRFLEGTVFQVAVLRLLGARIGQRVHIHRGVDLLDGGWDLLDIGDDVTLSQDVSLRLADLEDGQIVVGPIRLEDGCTLEIRSGVGSHTHLEAEASLTPLSFLASGGRVPRGEAWDGIPAKCSGYTSERFPGAQRSSGRKLTPAWHGFALAWSAIAVNAVVWLPSEILAVAFALFYGIDADATVSWLYRPSFDVGMVLTSGSLMIMSVPLTLITKAAVMRLLGRIPAGAIDRWSIAYIRVWIKTGLLESACHWLSGTLLWPLWLRATGMQIGRGSEIGTITDTVPELVDIGNHTFFADGIYLGGPRIHRGVVELAPVKLGNNTFLGNHSVIPAGQSLPDDILLGVCTIVEESKVRRGSSWFGHPAFELPKRETVLCDRKLTHEPTALLRIRRFAWEFLRFTLPLVPLWIGLISLVPLYYADSINSWPIVVFGVVPVLEMSYAVALCLIVLITKWLLLGRVQPGRHPLYSSWCSRWDFHYVVWDYLGLTPLSALEGTLLLNTYLRAMGMRIGRNVALGNGFAHVVDPDMLEFGDNTTVSCQFQAHTFEDRVLKIDYVWIRPKATVGNLACLLYGADIGKAAYVAPHSVVMKQERLLPRRTYAGCPTRAI